MYRDASSVQLDVKGMITPVAARIIDVNVRAPKPRYFELAASASIRRTPSSNRASGIVSDRRT